MARNYLTHWLREKNPTNIGKVQERKKTIQQMLIVIFLFPHR